MSLLYKRQDGRSPFWYVTQTRESTGTANRKDAEAFARKTLKEAWDDKTGGGTYTWGDLAEHWTDLKSQKKSFKDDLRIIKDVQEWLQRRGLGDADVRTFDSEAIREYAKFIKARASMATANNHLAIIRAIFNKTPAKWGIATPKFEFYTIVKKTFRWLENMQEFDALTSGLPQFVRDMAIIAMQTGMRYGNVAGMRWEWINKAGTVAHVPAESAKGRRIITVPLNEIARAVIEKLRAARIKGAEYVFWQDGRRPYIRHWWDQARERSGIHCRFHDLRHSWSSWHLQNGTPDRIVQEMGGWAGPQMLQRYQHLNAGHLIAYADNLNTGAP